jgi:putative hydrolase of the HAD superfamily
LESDPDYSAIVYDFGGVLVEIDFDRVIACWARHSQVPFAMLKPRFGHGLAYQAHERGEIEVAEYFQALRGELDIDIPDAAFAEGWNAVFGEEIAPTIDIVRRLAAAIPQYVFSNTNAEHHRHWAGRYRQALAPLSRQFVSHEMRLRKPERPAFEMISREIGVPPERILFFDDTAANVDAACALGFGGVLVRSPVDVARALTPWLGEAAAST